MGTFTVSGAGSVPFSAGQTLYDALSPRGLTEGPCGGSGRCGKCRVRLLTPCPALPEEERFFTADELSHGWRLACLHEAADGMALELPRAQDGPAPLTEGLDAQVRPDGESGLGVAVDIGTTTVAAALVERRTGHILARTACLNSQRAFGQDVITRIDFAMREEGGLARMQAAVCGDVARLTDALCREAGADVSAIASYAVAANNVMTHIFTGADPRGLAAYPFTPAYTGERCVGAGALGLPGRPDAEVYCLPAVSAYVGGDITAGMLVCDLPARPGSTLFLDIGTNGEMVLCRDGALFSCSCAAGPALEGMDIRCGMRAAAGAVENARVVWQGDTPRWRLETIGGEAPRGLCGSGLLSAVTELVRCGAIGPNGRLQLHPLVTAEDGKRRCVLAGNLYLTQPDIRQVQLAKGAILAGVDILLQEAGLTAAQLDKVLVAGQFGAHLTPRSLVGAGLLDGALMDKIAYVGNTSLAGAVACLLSREMRQKALTMTENVRYLELSAWPGYEKALMAAMRFAPLLPRYVCDGRHPDGASVAGGPDPAAWHTDPAAIRFAAEKSAVSGWYVLPFCSTLLAEALGAECVLTPGGARIPRPVYDAVSQLPAAPSFTTPRLTAMGQALAALNGKNVIYQLDGPLTVLTELLPMGRLFSALRKDDAPLRLAEDWVCACADWAVEKGVTVLSLADPVATLDVLGEKTFRGLYLPCLLRLLHRLAAEHPDLPLHLCGKMTQSLLDVQAADALPLDFDAPTYGDALAQFCDSRKGGLIGHFCVHRLADPRPTVTVLTLRGGASAPR